MEWKKHNTPYYRGRLKQTSQLIEVNPGKRVAKRFISQSQPRYGGARAIGVIVARLVGTILGHHYLDESVLLTQWPVIVGHKIAAGCVPIRLIFYRKIHVNGTLHLKVGNGSLAVELQHSCMSLIKRINTYFGRPMINRIKITQGVLPQKIPSSLLLLPSKKNVLPPTEEAALVAELAPVNNNILRETLMRLGRHILQRNRG